jgi:hypothetical protein
VVGGGWREFAAVGAGEVLSVAVGGSRRSGDEHAGDAGRVRFVVLLLTRQPALLAWRCAVRTSVGPGCA